MATTSNIESLSNGQLRALLFGPNEHEGFFQATSEYMNDLNTLQSHEITNGTQILTLETNAQNTLTTLTEQQTQQVNQDYQQEAAMQPPSMPSWLSDLVSVFMFLGSCITLDPVLIGVTGTGLVMQASGGQAAMVQAVCGDNEDLKAGFEFGVAATEALIAGGASLIAAGEQVSEEASAQAAQMTWKSFAKSFAKNTLSYSGQTLLQNNFWLDFFQGPCQMGDTAGMIVGMIFGVGFAMGASAFSEENGLTRLFKGKIWAKWGQNAEKYLRWFTLGINIGAAGFEVGASVQNFEIGKAFLNLADFQKNKLAPAESTLAFYQGLAAGWIPVITTTQSNISSLTEFASAENQTFGALANMFKTPG